MSGGGFDFDALRDPLAPEPGPRERAGVDARARQMNARNRRTRIVLSATSLVAVAAIVFGVVALTRNPGPTVTVEGPSTTLPPTTTPTTYGPSNAGRFIPPTTVQNGLVVLPVTLPDGESFTVKYPPAMKIAQLGFAGTSYVDGRQIALSYTTIQHEFRDSDKPVHVYPGANGSQVFLFHASQQAGNVGAAGAEVLAYQFGPWLAVVDAPPPKETDPATLARSLSGTVDRDGYLVLHSDSFAIGDGFEGGFGTSPGNSLQLAAHLYCSQPGSDTSVHRSARNADGSQYVSWCDGELHVSAGGTPEFLANAKALQVSPLVPATGNTTVPTTTTTTAPANSPAALSSTWVSPQQGFVLEQSGTIAATTDGGATWQKVGALPLRGDRQEKLRYIDATDGFAFGENTRAPALQITHDGGATWIGLDTPFAEVFDLAISHGMVYVVGLPPKNTGHLGIWSTPVEHLVWKQSPLALQLGAGPDPTAQIVLQGTAGWIIEVDRTVIAGARLSANGTWVSWSPPCLSVNGPATLSASTTNDLVASCNEGVWGPPAGATTVYFSHDAGTTFQRHTAPIYGLVASPNASTAVVIYGSTLQRTTDNGATWTAIDTNQSQTFAPYDAGFTTPAQGFAILGNGTMFMTYDAGARWQKVILP